MKGKTRTLPPIHERLSLERELSKAQFQVINKLATFVRNEIVPAARADRKEELKRFADSARDPRFDQFDDVAAALVAVASETVERVLNLDANRHTKAWINNVKRTLGVDLKAVVLQPDIAPEISEYLRINTDLITNVTSDLKKRVGLTVSNHVVNGGTVKDLGTALNGDFGFAKKRAELIAADQTQKFNASLTKARHRQAGIKQYRWLTSQDERVRSLHVSLNGKVYGIDEQTGAEGGQAPGIPIRCRCVAIALLDEVQTPTLEPQQEQTIADEAKDYVVKQGKSSGHEHLFTINMLTGAKIATNTSGRKSHVGLDNKTGAAIFGPDKIDIEVHHNHPSSSAFSLADLNMLTGRNNLKVLWAHGHDGSSYRGEAAKKGQISDRAFDLALGKARDQLMPSVSLRRVSIKEAEQVMGHITMQILAKRGWFKYDYELSERQIEIMQRVEGNK